MKYSKARELISEAIEQLDELSDAKMRGYLMKSAYNAAVDAPTHGVKKRLKGIGTALKSMAGYRSPKNQVNEARQTKGSAKDLRNMIDLHGNQVQVHAQLYNRTMNPEHRSQAHAHQEEHGKAVEAYKKATGKEYYGKVIKKRDPIYLKTTGAHRSGRLGAAGQPGGFNW